MPRRRLAALLNAILGLSVFALALAPAEAQSRSSGGRSYSSGAGGKGSSSGSSSKSSRFSSGKSYSSGSSTPKRASSFSSGSSSSRRSSFYSGGRSFSSGGSSTGSKPPKGSYDSGAGRAQKQAESSSSFSSRTKPMAPPVVKPAKTAPSAGSTTSRGWGGKTYSSGRSSSPAASPEPPRRPVSSGGKTYSSSGRAATSQRPPLGSTYDRAAAAELQRQESRQAFTKGTAPQPSYTDPTGGTQSINPKDRRIEDLRRNLDQERWENRELRKRETYRPYYSQPAPPVVVYRDPYSDLFWWWLLAQGLDQRARWAYHHRDSMDQDRYRELLKRDVQLEGRLQQFEQEGVKRDPSYQPQGVDRDLMYTDQYVEAAYNPQPIPEKPAPAGERGSGRSALTTLLIIALILAFLCFAIWFVFFKRWGGT